MNKLTKSVSLLGLLGSLYLNQGCAVQQNTEAVVLPTASAAYIDSLAEQTHPLGLTLNKETTLNGLSEKSNTPSKDINWKNEFAVLGTKSFSKFEYQPDQSDKNKRCFKMGSDTIIEHTENNGRLRSFYACFRVNSILRSSISRIQLDIDEDGFINTYSTSIEQKLVFEHKKNSFHTKAVLIK